MITHSFTGKLSMIVLFAFFVLNLKPTVAATRPDDLPSLKGKKILMVWGGWEGHEPKQVTYKLKPFLEKEGAVI